MSVSFSSLGEYSDVNSHSCCLYLILFSIELMAGSTLFWGLTGFVWFDFVAMGFGLIFDGWFLWYNSHMTLGI